METPSDITVHLPAEYFDALSEVIQVGLQRAKIDSKTRTALVSWWRAEHDFVADEVDRK